MVPEPPVLAEPMAGRDNQRVAEPQQQYSVEQANQLLPVLTPVLNSVVRELGTATDARALSQVRAAASHNGGGAAASAMLRAGRRLERELEFLREHGILLRDPEVGLVDFPSQREGRLIYLCWRLGEPEVQFWHARDEGFVDGQPL